MAAAIALSTTAEVEKSFGERLGWKSNDVVVILHVDDVGMSHSSNLGAMEATSKGVATSCSVMMPCAWVSEFARYLKAPALWSMRIRTMRRRRTASTSTVCVPHSKSCHQDR